MWGPLRLSLAKWYFLQVEPSPVLQLHLRSHVSTPIFPALSSSFLIRLAGGLAKTGGLI